MSIRPHESGYRLAAEWHPHTSTWLSWPHNEETWPGGLLAEVERTYAGMILFLVSGEIVDLLVDDSTMEDRARAVLCEQGVNVSRVLFHHIPTVDVWIRDYGPTFLVGENRIAMIHWLFNGWGNKYPDYPRDTVVPGRINEQLQLPFFEPGIVLEGGAIDTNGLGTLLTTKQCLLNPNRNPSLTMEQIEQILGKYLGVRHIIWLNEGVAGDDTDGHVDDIARFVDPVTVICAVEDDMNDENYEALKGDFAILCRSTDQDGRKLNIVKLPMPGRIESSGRRLPASYANFYIANEVVLVPTYDSPNDERALGILQNCFADRRVIGIDCRALVHGYGAIHCVTNQQISVSGRMEEWKNGRRKEGKKRKKGKEGKYTADDR